jgi:hypothetical protein
VALMERAPSYAVRRLDSSGGNQDGNTVEAVTDGIVVLADGDVLRPLLTRLSLEFLDHCDRIQRPRRPNPSAPC